MTSERCGIYWTTSTGINNRVVYATRLHQQNDQSGNELINKLMNEWMGEWVNEWIGE